MKSPLRSSSRHLLAALSLMALGSLPFACRGESATSISGGDGDGNGDGDSGGESGGGEISDTPHALEDADNLFDATTIPVFAVTVPEDRWDFMNADPALEQYEPGELTFNGEEIGPVGIRFKGSVGSLTGCLQDDGRTLADDCDKFSFKLKFSEYDKNQRFFGMKRLNFHGMARDKSKLHDKISYKIYRDAGIIAPRSTWACLEVNGESLGLFALVEQIDGRFTDNRWPDDGDGNLYKEKWPDSTDPEGYVEKLKTNEDEASVGSYISFAQAMDAAEPSQYLETLGAWMDLEKLYTYIAVSDSIANWDGITAFYCGSWGCTNHNYYMYESESADHFTLVPWDLDSTLSAATPHDHIPHWTSPGDCDARYSLFSGWVDGISAGCNNVFIALNSDRSRYEEKIDEVLSGPFDIEQISADIDTYVDFISDEIAADPALDGVEPWLLEVESLRDNLALLKQRAEAFRDGEDLSPLTLTPGEVQDFESANPLQFVVSNTYWLSPGSTANFNLNTDTPLSGAQDARVDFVFRDGAEPWSQWLGWIMNISPAATDLSGFTGIRLTVQSDQDRTVRLDLESPYQPNAPSGARLGWEFPVTNTPSTVELIFADSAIPSWATSGGEQLEEVLTQVTNLIVNPGVIRGTDGFIGEGMEDPGFFQVDDIEVY